jgi:hypothetical protein
MIKHLSLFVYCLLLRFWLENFSPDRTRLLGNYLLFLFICYFFLFLLFFLFLYFVIINHFFYYFCNFLIEKFLLNSNFIGVRNLKYEWFLLFWLLVLLMLLVLKVEYLTTYYFFLCIFWILLFRWV